MRPIEKGYTLLDDAIDFSGNIVVDQVERHKGLERFARFLGSYTVLQPPYPPGVEAVIQLENGICYLVYPDPVYGMPPSPFASSYINALLDTLDISFLHWVGANRADFNRKFSMIEIDDLIDLYKQAGLPTPPVRSHIGRAFMPNGIIALSPQTKGALNSVARKLGSAIASAAVDNAPQLLSLLTDRLGRVINSTNAGDQLANYTSGNPTALAGIIQSIYRHGDPQLMSMTSDILDTEFSIIKATDQDEPFIQQLKALGTTLHKSTGDGSPYTAGGIRHADVWSSVEYLNSVAGRVETIARVLGTNIQGAQAFFMAIHQTDPVDFDLYEAYHKS